MSSLKKKLILIFVKIERHSLLNMNSNSNSNSYNVYTSAQATSPAICIPRVFKNISERRIAAIFAKLDLGEIVQIDMVPSVNRTGDEFYRVFVHIAWGTSSNALQTRSRLAEPNGEVKIVYDDPWFWKLRASNSKGRRQRIQRPEPFIMTRDEASAPVSESNGDVVTKPNQSGGSSIEQSSSTAN